ncbi:hypothetical protein CDD80_763 [Ophiocordyceps camponoti-rufipedis]|uniref:Uncharacterized protein n=1 Tax=Ophiocordyceps camponoti-rufipedis TaxID=2004952 RepID=A0A2C5YKI9_9HYPO|nr:hypothetical protein CDD80_763 [Ophiocordyceps camponoti-rufipedis]
MSVPASTDRDAAPAPRRDGKESVVDGAGGRQQVERYVSVTLTRSLIDFVSAGKDWMLLGGSKRPTKHHHPSQRLSFARKQPPICPLSPPNSSNRAPAGLNQPQPSKSPNKRAARPRTTLPFPSLPPPVADLVHPHEPDRC